MAGVKGFHQIRGIFSRDALFVPLGLVFCYLGKRVSGDGLLSSNILAIESASLLVLLCLQKKYGSVSVLKLLYG